MIDRDEIRQKSDEFGIHTAHVQRDHVFGWLLYGIYSASRLRDALILKGGNCFRKAYFPQHALFRRLGLLNARCS